MGKFVRETCNIIVVCQEKFPFISTRCRKNDSGKRVSPPDVDGGTKRANIQFLSGRESKLNLWAMKVRSPKMNRSLYRAQINSRQLSRSIAVDVLSCENTQTEGGRDFRVSARTTFRLNFEAATCVHYQID